MAKIIGGNIVTKILKDAGVDNVFAVTGGHISYMWPMFERAGIKLNVTCNEGMASYAAMGYAQATGKMGVVICTAGPAVTHAITGICDADMYDTPVLFIGGSYGVGDTFAEGLQEYHTVDVLKTCTKDARRCEHTDQIAKYLTNAIKRCNGFNPGPVYLEIPVDVLELTEIEEDNVKYPVNYMANRRTGASPQVVEEIADKLIAAKKPAMLIGEGVQFGAEDMTAFKELAEYLKLPTSVLLTNKGKFFSEADPMFRIGFEAGTEADVILGFNYATDAEFGGWYINPDATFINITTDWDDFGVNEVESHIGVIGHGDVIARQILNCVKEKTAERADRSWADSVWEKTKADFQPLMDEAFDSDMLPIHPARMTHECIKFLNSEEGKEFVYNPCGGDILEWTRVNHRMLMDDAASFPNRLFHGTKFGCIGSQLGELTGVWAATKRPILHTDGDGSFCENFSEVITYAKLGIPVITVLSVNGDYEMIEYAMRMGFPDDPLHTLGSQICQVDGSGFKFSALADLFGGYGEEVYKPEDIVPAIKRAAETGKPAIIAVHTKAGNDVISPVTRDLTIAVLGE